MTELEAIELLGKLKKFMEDTVTAITGLQIQSHNQKVDIEKLKKQTNQNRILVRD